MITVDKYNEVYPLHQWGPRFYTLRGNWKLHNPTVRFKFYFVVYFYKWAVGWLHV